MPFLGRLTLKTSETRHTMIFACYIIYDRGLIEYLFGKTIMVFGLKIIFFLKLKDMKTSRI